MAFLSTQKIRSLKKRIKEVEIEDEFSSERLHGKTLASLKKLITTGLAFHRLADIASKFINDTESRVLMGEKVSDVELQLSSDLSQELVEL